MTLGIIEVRGSAPGCGSCHNDVSLKRTGGSVYLTGVTLNLLGLIGFPSGDHSVECGRERERARKRARARTS
jgi:hypothetical protein